MHSIGGINLKEFKHNVTKKFINVFFRFYTLKNYNEIFIIQQLPLKLQLFKISLTSDLKLPKTIKYLNNQLTHNMEKIKKYLHKYNIFLISEILYLCDITYLKIILTKLNYLEIYLFFFILIFDVLILLKFKYKYIFFLV